MIGTLKFRLIAAGVLALAMIVLVTGARLYWINKGISQAENKVAVRTQEKVIEHEKKLRPIRSYRPGIKRVAERLRKHTF